MLLLKFSEGCYGLINSKPNKNFRNNENQKQKAIALKPRTCETK